MCLFYGFKLGVTTTMISDIVFEKPMITAKDLSLALDVPYEQCLEVVKAVCQEMEKRGIYVLKTKPQKVPTGLVLQMLGISYG